MNTNNGTFRAAKKRVGVFCEYRMGTNPSKEPARIQEKVRQSLYKTLKWLAFLTEVQDVGKLNAFFEDFMKDVYVDSLYITASINPNTKNIQISGLDTIIPESVFYNELQTVHKNRRFVNGRNSSNTTQWAALHKGITTNKIPNHVMIAVGVNNHSLNGNSSKMHHGHMICAFKHVDTLYCFNPWGATYKQRNTPLPDELIWEKLRVLYKCTHSIVYTGYNFQETDTKGACAGFGYNFGAHMYNYILTWRFIRAFSMKTPYTLKYPSVPTIVSVNQVYNYNSQAFPFMFHSVRFNQFVMDLFDSYQGVFGRSTFNVSKPHNSVMLVFKNLTQRNINIVSSNSSNNEYTRRRKVSNKSNNLQLGGEDNSNVVYNAITRAMNTNNNMNNMNTDVKTKFITNMRNSKWSLNNTNTTNNMNVNLDNVKKRNYARREVVRYLKSNNKRLANVHHNTIQSIVRRYAKSGNI